MTFDLLLVISSSRYIDLDNNRYYMSTHALFSSSYITYIGHDLLFVYPMVKCRPILKVGQRSYSLRILYTQYRLFVVVDGAPVKRF